MKKIFGGIFGRAEKSVPTSPSTIVIDGEEYDIEYVKYCIEKDRTVSTLEAKLHESDDPQEIAVEALKASCRFHGGDWAGILDVDLDLDIWTPLWWYNAKPNDKTTVLFGEFQIAKFMPNWIEALKTGSSVCITDMSSVQREYPEEYEIYKRLQVDSVIGVPFGPNPVGILAIRNPTRYIKYDSALNVFLKKAVSLYKGSVFENADGELWIKNIATHYRLLYIGMVNELLSTLDEAEDFTGVRQYASQAVKLTPENTRAHYWLLHAMNHLGTLELARNHITHAREMLTSDEFTSLKKHVAQDSTMPYTVLFSDG